MPCFTGRAGHTLLRKDCPSGCACCVNTAYSCGQLKCNETLTNSKKVELCDTELLFNIMCSEPTSDGQSLDLDALRLLINLAVGFAFLNGLDPSCNVPISIINRTNSQVTLIGTVANSMFEENANLANLDDNDVEYSLIVDGMQCERFFILTT